MPDAAVADSPASKPTNIRWVVFALGCGTSATLYLHRYVLGLIKPELSREYGLTNSDLADLDSAFGLTYAACQVPCGILIDLVGVHWFLGLSVLLWTFALLGNVTASTVGTFWYMRAAFGAAQAGAYAAMNRMTRSWFPDSVRTQVQGWIGVTSGRLGAAAANILFATVLMGVFLLSWRQAVYCFASVGIALGIAFLILFRNTPREHPLVNEAEADLIDGPALVPSGVSVPRSSVGELLRQMKFWSLVNLGMLALQTTLSTVADLLYSNWIPQFLSQVHGLNYKEMGFYSMLPLLGGACGGAAGGMLNDWLMRRSVSRRWSRTIVGISGKGLAGVALLAALLAYDNPYVFCSLLFAVKFFSDWSLAATWGTVTDIGGRATATVFAVNNGIASLGNYLGPQLYGYVADNYGWPPVFVCVGVIYMLCAATWLGINCERPLVEPSVTSR